MTRAVGIVRAVLSKLAFGLTILLLLRGEAAAQPVRVMVLPLVNPVFESAFRRGLKEVDLIEGRDVVIEWRRFEVTDANLKSLPAELRKAERHVIVTLGSQLTRVALQTAVAPVVFVVGDPIRAGFANSLSRPGGIGTGVSVVTTDLDAKRMELLRQLAPKAKRIAFLRNPASAFAGQRYLDDAATSLGLELVRLNAQNLPELDVALHALSEGKADALLVGGDVMFLQNKAKIARAVRQTKIPAVFPWAEYHDDGVLASYAPDLARGMRRAASYVDLIVKGMKPGELPIEQLSTYELTIDLRVAREIGVLVPEDLLLRADKVIR